MAESEIDDTSETSYEIKKKTSFAGDILKLVGGTTIVQVLGILFTPIITRLYAPDAFGLSAIFISITGILCSIACLRYDFAILLPKRDNEAANLLGLSLLFAILISALTIPIIWFWQQLLLTQLKAPELGQYLWMLPPSVFFGGSFLALNYWASRNRQFGRLSLVRIVSSVATIGIQLGAGFAGYTTGGSLIVASVLSSIISAIVLGAQILREDWKMLGESINYRNMVIGLNRYRKFPLFDTWSTLINNTSWQLPTLLLAVFFTPAVVGFYALGFTLIQLPMSLIGSAIAQVFSQRASDALKEGTLASTVESVFRFLVLISMFPMLILAIIGKDVFIVFFGESWAEAGVYAQMLSIWAIVWFISSPLSTVILVLEKQEFGLKLSTINFITRFVAIAIGGILNDARLSILLFSISGLFVYGYLLLLIVDVSRVERSHVFRILIHNFVLFIPAGVILIILEALNISPWAIIIVSGTLLALYYVYIIKSDPEIYNIINNKIFLKTIR